MSSLAEQRKAALDTVMRDGIFDAAVRVLKEKGLEGVTMERVAQAAGVAKGTLYNYFQDKDSLLRDTHSRLFDPVRQACDRIADSELAPPEKLAGVLREAFGFFQENHLTLRVFDRSAFSACDRDAKRDQFVAMVERIVEEGKRLGSFRGINPRQAGEMIVGALTTFFEARLYRDEEVDVDRDLKEMTDFFLYGLAASPARSD